VALPVKSNCIPKDLLVFSHQPSGKIFDDHPGKVRGIKPVRESL
jgi:hypothetical protein